MRTRAAVALLVAVSSVALLPSGAAIARTRPANRYSTIPPELGAQFLLPASNGYEVTVSLKNRRLLRLTALRYRKVIQSASYSLRIRPRRSDEIVADLGHLGRIDARFVPKKVLRGKAPKECRGPKTVIERGYFAGTIIFHGEGGFTRVSADHAPGLISRVPSYQCPPVAPTPNAKKLRERLEAQEKAAKPEVVEAEEKDGVESLAVRLHAVALGGRVELTASKLAERPKHGKGLFINTLLAEGILRRGRIVERDTAAEIFGKGSTLLVPNRKDPKSEGILRPPAPFSGSGTFRRHLKRPPTWTGNLEVDLPAFGQVRLAGPGTHASMCEGTACLLRDITSERVLSRARSVMAFR